MKDYYFCLLWFCVIWTFFEGQTRDYTFHYLPRWIKILRNMPVVALALFLIFLICFLFYKISINLF